MYLILTDRKFVRWHARHPRTQTLDYWMHNKENLAMLLQMQFNICLSSDCRGLVAPKNGSLSASAVVHGRHLTVSCNAGYTLSGDRSLVCSSGSLSGKIGTCEAGKTTFFTYWFNAS